MIDLELGSATEYEHIPYNRFARAYDDMMSHVDYRRWVNYVGDLFKLYGVQPARVLDLACGTGSVAIPMAQHGYDVVGIDRAPGMLEVAEDKADQSQVDIDWREGDMRDLGIEAEFDAVICLYDSVNYMLSASELRMAFESVGRALRPGGIFIFDVISERNIVRHFHSKTFAENHPEYTFIWKNVYTKYDKVCRTEITFFYRGEDKTFRRSVETHVQKIFELRDIRAALKHAGLKYLSAFDAWTFTKYDRHSDRINVTARKDGK